MSDTLICSVELNKINGTGITVNVQNDSGNVTQTIHMDGTTLTITVKGANSTSTITQDATSFTQKVAGPSDTSTIVQVQDKITVTVKAFEVDAETVLVKSSKTSDHQATGAFTIKTDDKLTTTSTMDTSITGQNATMEGQMKATVKGGTEADVQAAQVKVTGQATCDVTSPMTTIGDTMTTVKGQMTTISGSLIKIG